MPTESSSDFKDKFDSTASAAPTSAADTPRAWWFAETAEDGTSDFSRFRGFDVTLVYLRELMEKHAPIQGILGFSQGAASAAILAALVENPQLDPVFSAPPKDENTPWPPKPFDFAILSAGFLPLDPKVKAYFDVKPKTPTLHVLGRADTIVGEGESSSYCTHSLVLTFISFQSGQSRSHMRSSMPGSNGTTEVSRTNCRGLASRCSLLPRQQVTTPQTRRAGDSSLKRT